MARQPLFPTAREGAARALQGMPGREVFPEGEGEPWNSSCCAAGARVLPGDWPVLWSLLSLQRVGGPSGASRRFHWLRQVAAFWRRFLPESSGCFAPAVRCVARK